MIISASYKTDIPAFYGEWLVNRLRAGMCRTVNPYSRKVMTIDLRREAVDGIVFWTKNLGPFIRRLQDVESMGYPFVVQYAINAYPRELEKSVVDAAQSINHMRLLSHDFGPRVGVWRYDPIVFTSLTTVGFHREKFRHLAQGLEGCTDEVVISFAQVYKKTFSNMNRAAVECGFSWEDPIDAVKMDLAGEFSDIARSHGMVLSVCSQRRFAVNGATDARCVDAQRLSDVSGRTIRALAKGNREECACHQSRDIGEYDTCPHGCVYCYAVRNRELAKKRYAEHDPNSDFLFASANVTSDEDDGAATDSQFHLFHG